VTDGLNWEEVHRTLQDVLESLTDVIKTHPSLNSADLLHLTASIITSVKGLSCVYFFHDALHQVSKALSGVFGGFIGFGFLRLNRFL